MYKILLLFFALLLINSAFAQTYQRNSGGSSNDVLYSSTGSFRYGKAISAGYTEGFGSSNKDIIVVESDPTGINWSFRLGGSGDDVANWVERNLSDSTYILMGYTNNVGTGKDLFVCKFDTLGNIIWQKTIHSPGDEEIKDGNEWIFDNGSGVDTFYVFTGSFDGPLSLGGNDLFYLVLDKNGNEVSMRQIGTASDDLGSAITTIGMAQSSHFMMTGSSNQFGNYDVWSLELDSTGSITLANNFDGGNDDFSTDISPTVYGFNTNRYQAHLIIGNTNSLGTGDEDGLFLHFNQTDSSHFAKRYGKDGRKENIGKLEDFGGQGVVFAGSYENDQGNMDGLILFTDRTGNLEAARGFSQCPSDEVFYDVANIPGLNAWSSNAVAVGHTNMVSGRGGEDFLEAKYDSPFGLNSGCKDVSWGWDNLSNATYTHSFIESSITEVDITGAFTNSIGTLTKTSILIADSSLCTGNEVCGMSTSWTNDTLELCATSLNIQVFGECIDSIFWYKNDVFISRDNELLNATVSGMYRFKAHKGFCSLEDSVYLDFTIPSVVHMFKQNFCLADTTIFEALGTIGNYDWDFGDFVSGALNTTSGMEVKHFFAAPGTYNVKLIPQTGCSSADTIYETIIISPVPTYDLRDTTLCDGDSVILDATTPNALYKWHNSSFDSVQVAKTSGKYWVNVHVDGCLKSDTAIISFVSAPVRVLPKDTVGCIGDSVLLDAQNVGSSFLWSNSSTSSSLFAKTSGQYSVIITAGNCEVKDTANVSFLTAPSVDLGKDSILCLGDTLLLEAKNAGANYTWQNTTNDSIFKVISNGLYWVEANIAGCLDRDSVNVTFSARPEGILPTDSSGCIGSLLTLDAKNTTLTGLTYEWNNGANSQSISASNDSLYIVTMTNGACIVKDSSNITFLTAPSVDLGKDSVLCEGDSLVLNATNASSIYEWSNATSNSTLTAKTTGLFWVEVTLGGCMDQDSINLTFNDTPDALLPDTSFGCDGINALLDAGNTGTSYAWSNSATTQTLSTLTFGTYSVILTKGNCIEYDTTEVVFRPNPVVDLGKDTSLCENQTLTLNAQNTGSQFNWSGGNTSQTLSVSTAGVYSVSVTLNQCITKDTIAIDFVSYPIKTLVSPLTYCIGDSVLLDASLSGGNDYSWSNGTINQSVITVTTSGLYKVIIRNQMCSISDSSQVNFISAPNVSFTDTTLCAGQNFQLNASNDGFFYQWHLKNDTNIIGTDSFLTINQSNIYVVEVYQDNCTKAFERSVTFNEIPVLDLPNQLFYCESDAEDLVLSTQDGDYIYQWSTGETSNSIIIGSEGNYSLEIEDSIGCMNSDSTEVVALCETKIFVPNGFTPNGDGINDDLEIFGQNILEFNITILNQWGEQIFQSDDLDQRWDGMYNGKIVSGTYTAIIRYQGEFQYGLEYKSFSLDITVLK